MPNKLDPCYIRPLDRLKKTKGEIKIKVTALILSFLVCAITSLSAHPGPYSPANTKQERMTPEMIISKCAEAMGGMEKIIGIKTLRMNEIYPDHGEHPMIFEMKRPNLFRNPRANLVFDGKRAFFLKGPDNNLKPELVPEDEWKDFEMEFFFPMALLTDRATAK